MKNQYTNDLHMHTHTYTYIEPERNKKFKSVIWEARVYFNRKDFSFLSVHFRVYLYSGGKLREKTDWFVSKFCCGKSQSIFISGALGYVAGIKKSFLSKPLRRFGRENFTICKKQSEWKTFRFSASDAKRITKMFEPPINITVFETRRIKIQRFRVYYIERGSTYVCFTLIQILWAYNIV